MTFLSSFCEMRLHVLYIDSSILGHAKSMAAANMDTEIVLPKRRGVLTRISCGVASQPLTSSSRACERAKAPGPSLLKKILLVLFSC